MKIIDEIETQRKQQTNKQTNKQHKQTNTEKNKGERSYSEWAKAK